MCTVQAVIQFSLDKNKAEQIVLLLSLTISVLSRQSQHQNSPASSNSSCEISSTKINEYVIGCAGEHSPNMNEAILAQTAQAKVYSPADSGLSAKIRVLQDLGSQRSYITK